ncbi:hypothetical protein [Streptomyces sp. NPDC093600]|uniref:hypothetical protein n=1 Tax=Streptomyces sp. NPDC093600 TaxID=3366047 RepID=UPI0037F746D2
MTDLVPLSPGRLPAPVTTGELLALAANHHARTVHPLGTHEASGHLVKVYAIEAPGREVAAQQRSAALRLAADHLATGGARGSLGLAVLLVHAGGDGDYVLVHTWIEGYMSDLAIFTGPAGATGQMRPGRQGLAPCVWEAAVLAHERNAFSRHVLSGEGELAKRLTAWGDDVMSGEVR